VIRGGLALDSRRALHVPKFNELISDACTLWPQARAKRDAEKVALVSVEANGGWYYDLWYPAYMWAETPHRWRAPGLTLAGSSNGYYFEHAPLKRTIQELQSNERNTGIWSVVERIAPFSDNPGRGFPIVATFVSDEWKPAVSSLLPDVVAERIAQAYP
jgi:hypothetical protein